MTHTYTYTLFKCWYNMCRQHRADFYVLRIRILRIYESKSICREYTKDSYTKNILNLNAY